MMVAVALLSVIVLGLTAMFLQTQKAFKSGLRQVDVFEGGRSVVSLMTRDLEQMADGQSPEVTNFAAYFQHQGTFIQYETNGPVGFARTNFLEDVYCLSRVGRTWNGIGYAVDNTVNGAVVPGVGTLYRFCTTTNATFPWTNLYEAFRGANSFSNTNFHRVADGVIHFQVRAFDTNGIEMFEGWSPQPPVFPIVSNNIVLTKLPSYLQIELGVLEPETLAQARSLGNSTSISNFLRGRMSKVHIFRQQVPIRTAPHR